MEYLAYTNKALEMFKADGWKVECTRHRLSIKYPCNYKRKDISGSLEFCFESAEDQFVESLEKDVGMLSQVDRLAYGMIAEFHNRYPDIVPPVTEILHAAEKASESMNQISSDIYTIKDRDDRKFSNPKIVRRYALLIREEDSYREEVLPDITSEEDAIRVAKEHYKPENTISIELVRVGCYNIKGIWRVLHVDDLDDNELFCLTEKEKRFRRDHYSIQGASYQVIWDINTRI